MPLDFLNLFVHSPGDVIYFIVLIAISQAALFMALGERWRQPDSRSSGRYTLASLGIVLTWVVLMLGALYAVIANQNIDAILPPLERTANVVILLFVGWAFLTADHERWGRTPNILLLLLLAVVIGGYVLTGFNWLDAPDQSSFNLSSYGVAWAFIPAVFSLLGIICMIAYFRYVADAPLKLLFFVILTFGYGVTLFQISQYNLIGNYAGTARLAMLASFPLLPIIVYRMIINHLQNELTLQANALPNPSIEPNGISFISDSTPVPMGSILPPSPVGPNLSPVQRDNVQLLKTLGLILEDATPGSIPQRVVTAGLEVLKAEVGAVLTLQDANYADVSAAFDKASNQIISGMALNLDNQPTLVNAVERRLQRPIYPDRNADELRDLYNRLDISQVGPTYFQPLMSGKELVAVLMIGMPYSGRELEEAERELLKGIGIIAGNLLALSYAARDSRLKAEERAIQALVQGVPLDDISDTGMLAARQEMQASLQASREQVSDLTRQVTQLRIELDHERNRVASAIGDTEEGLSVSQRILALNDEHDRLRQERDRLMFRLQEAETALAGATATHDDSVMKTMIEVLRREKDDLLSQRDNMQNQLAQLRSGIPIAEAPQAVQEVLERMSQEKAHLEIEREQLSSKLTDINAQLNALGIENGVKGLAQLIAQLTEQRAILQAKVETLALERDALFNERHQLEEGIKQEKERAARIQALENELKFLASDREALTKEREQLRGERDDLVAKQETFKQQRARLIAEAAGYQVELAEAHQNQAKLRVQLQQLADEKSEFIKAQNRLVAEKQAAETEHNLLLARTEGNRDRIYQLGEDGIGSLTRMIEEISEQRAQLERQLNEAQMQLASSQNKLDALQIRSSADMLPPIERSFQRYDPELFLGMVQELRTPLTSVVGYLDLLIDESAGILGEMQRKFLQRVAANVTRMTFMLEDLTRMTALDGDRLILMSESVDVINLIEDAISNSTYEFREKNLAVNLDLDDTLPSIRADRDAITQIIKQLLTNAYLAAPTNSQIFITAHRQEVQLSSSENLAQPTDSVLISVEDRGGGIPPDELPRVFARKYKAENPLIPGLGDTGVGLSIAKTLVEAHGGGLWVETRLGIGSIFYFALPIKTALETVKDN
ncbi:MAG: hypothetical protein K8L97_03005 [Anaerolineae bacterium]|nr:hypothetical protein [Anaerolineae bacterium]